MKPTATIPTDLHPSFLRPSAAKALAIQTFYALCRGSCERRLGCARDCASFHSATWARRMEQRELGCGGSCARERATF